MVFAVDIRSLLERVPHKDGVRLSRRLCTPSSALGQARGRSSLSATIRNDGLSQKVERGRKQLV